MTLNEGLGFKGLGSRVAQTPAPDGEPASENAAMIFEGARVAEERKQKPLRPRAAGGPVRLASECSGQGTSLQALAHLGLKAWVEVTSESDPSKRQLLAILHRCLQCRVVHNMTSVFPGGGFLCSFSLLACCRADSVSLLFVHALGPSTWPMSESIAGASPSWMCTRAAIRANPFSKAGTRRGAQDSRADVLIATQTMDDDKFLIYLTT